jgi:signal transduction histidine kinase
MNDESRRLLLVCQSYLAEATAVLEGEELQDLSVRAYPAACLRGQRASGSSGVDPAGPAAEDTCRIVCGARAGVASEPPEEGEHVVRLGRCFDAIAGRRLVDELLSTGAHLLTPGWLARWREHLREWGFGDRETARAFFAESARALVLLDTGIDPESPARLRELAEFVDRPAEVVTVGLDRYRTFLVRTLSEWRAAETRRADRRALAEAQRRAADFGMLVDLTGSLAQARSEREAIDRIFETFALLFGAERLVYVGVQEERPAEAYGWPAGRLPGPDQVDDLLSMSGDHARLSDGFRLRIRRGAETLGILEATGFEDRENLDRYLNVALSSVGACALALANASSYQRLQQSISELERTARELEERNRALDAFSHTVAHDLKAPLTSLIGFAGLALSRSEGRSSEELQPELERIVSIGHKMHAIVRELLLLAEVRKAQVETATLETASIVAEVRDRLATEIESTEATIIEPEAWPRARGHRPWIEQVWANLLGNALRYGGRPPRITLGADVEPDGMVRFTVSDQGPGIPDEVKRELFVPFGSAGRGSAGGHGLGLSIVRDIVSRFGGRVSVTSTPGHGASFSFTLPAAPPEAPQGQSGNGPRQPRGS